MASTRTSARQNSQRALVAVVMLAVSCFSGAGQAQPAGSDLLVPDSLVPMERTRPAISVEKATRLVRQRIGGRVLAAESAFVRGQSGVSVRVLLEGARVVTVFVDDQGRIRGR